MSFQHFSTSTSSIITRWENILYSFCSDFTYTCCMLVFGGTQEQEFSCRWTDILFSFTGFTVSSKHSVSSPDKVSFLLCPGFRVSTSWLFQRTLWTDMKERCRRDTCALIQNVFTSHLRTGARGASGRVPSGLPNTPPYCHMVHFSSSSTFWTCLWIRNEGHSLRISLLLLWISSHIVKKRDWLAVTQKQRFTFYCAFIVTLVICLIVSKWHTPLYVWYKQGMFFFSIFLVT